MNQHEFDARRAEIEPGILRILRKESDRKRAVARAARRAADGRIKRAAIVAIIATISLVLSDSRAREAFRMRMNLYGSGR